jgi:hypothetical protein
MREKPQLVDLEGQVLVSGNDDGLLAVADTQTRLDHVPDLLLVRQVAGADGYDNAAELDTSVGNQHIVGAVVAKCHHGCALLYAKWLQCPDEPIDAPIEVSERPTEIRPLAEGVLVQWQVWDVE